MNTVITDSQWELIRLRMEVEMRLYEVSSPMDFPELRASMSKFGTAEQLKSVLTDLGMDRKITMFSNDYSQIVWRDSREAPAKVYRMDMVRYSNGFDEWGDPNPGHCIDVTTNWHCVDRTTPRGYIVDGKFVGIGWQKRSWLPSLELARASFINLKRVHLKRLQQKTQDVETALRIASNFQNA